MRPTSPRRPARALAFALVLGAGCAGTPAPKKGAVSPSAVVAALDETPDPPVPPAHGHQVASLDRRTLGPFASRDSVGGLVAWVVPRNRGEGQDLVVVPTARDGAALRGAQPIAQVPSEATSLVVQPTGGKQRGWLVAWTALLDRGESVSVLGVAPDGSARGIPTDVQRTSDHVKWASIVPTPRGALCLWAEQTAMNDANIFVNALEADGKARGMPSRIAHGVVGWQALPAGEGAALALVSPVALGSSDRAEDRPPRPDAAGALAWLRLDADGHPLGNPAVVSSRPTVGGDIDVVARDGGWLLAWTDRTGDNAQVMFASVDDVGTVKGPAPALPAAGGSSLVGLASNPSGVLLAWVEPHARKHVERDVGLALVAPGALSAEALGAVRVAASPAPEVVGAASGFALLASARACKTSDTVAATRGCAGPLVPTFVRLGPRLDVVQTEPLFVGQGGTEPAAVAWELQCLDDGKCVALAAPGEAPTPVYAMDLPARMSPFAPPLPPAPPPDAPKVTGTATVASGAPFEDVVAAQVGEATVVAALAPMPEAKQGVARITLRALDAGGRLLGPVRTMSSHAVPVGGIAMAAGGSADDGAALAWVARDEGDAAVHLARLDRSAHATREVRVSPPKSDSSDVAVAWAGDGWVVAWVDAREGNGEVYATKVDRDLKRMGRDERITSAAGDAGGVSLAASGSLVWVAWSDPRDSPREGLADVFVAALHAKDASLAGREARVLATAAHSRSPQLVAAGDDGGALVGWIEDAPLGLEGPGAALLAKLEPGPVVGTPAPLPLAPGERPSSLAFVPEAGGARVIVAHPAADVLTLDALRVDADGRVLSRPTHLLDLDAPPVFEPSVALVPGALFYVDIGLPDGDRSHHRIRRAAVSWTR